MLATEQTQLTMGSATFQNLIPISWCLRKPLLVSSLPSEHQNDLGIFWNDTVDGRNPAPVDIYIYTGSLSHYSQGFIHPRWCRMSSINSFSMGNPWWKHQCQPHGALSFAGRSVTWSWSMQRWPGDRDGCFHGEDRSQSFLVFLFQKTWVKMYGTNYLWHLYVYTSAA